MQKLEVEAKMEYFSQVTQMVEEMLSEYACSPKILMQIQIALEEIFVNVAHYAYQTDEKPLTVQCEVCGEPPQLSVEFTDSGIPYNPLKRKEPNLTESAEERKIGGLGIYMVKQYMDEMTYAYKDGKNVLCIRKTIGKVE